MRRCYAWNNKANKLALTLLDIQGGIKATNYNWCYIHPLRANALSSSPHICSRCLGPPLVTPLYGQHVARVDAPNNICNTPLQNYLYGLALHVEWACIHVAPLLHFCPRFV